MIYCECPNCNKEFWSSLPRWDAKLICPNCSVFLYNDYDHYYDQETGEEFDITDLRVITELEFNQLANTDFSESEKL